MCYPVVLSPSRHSSSVREAPQPFAFRKLGSFVTGVGAPPDVSQLAGYIQRLRNYGFDASPIIRKFLACHAALTEDLVRSSGFHLDQDIKPYSLKVEYGSHVHHYD